MRVYNIATTQHEQVSKFLTQQGYVFAEICRAVVQHHNFIPGVILYLYSFYLYIYRLFGNVTGMSHALKLT